MTFFDGMGSFALYFFSFFTKWRISMSMSSMVTRCHRGTYLAFLHCDGVWTLLHFAFRQCHGADFLEKNFVDVLIANR
jgi:hypothetical protein